jgi:hypothetical protein
MSRTLSINIWNQKKSQGTVRPGPQSQVYPSGIVECMKHVPRFEETTPSPNDIKYHCVPRSPLVEALRAGPFAASESSGCIQGLNTEVCGTHLSRILLIKRR